MGQNLRDRVATNTGREQPAPGAEVERKKPTTLAEQIEAKADKFQQAMPRGMEARQLIRDAMSLIRQQPQLAKCNADSVLGGLMTFAQLGLRPGVLGHGWLIPFKKRALVDGKWRDVWEAQVVIGYKGYGELIHRTGQVSTMVGRIVHERDTFDIEYGLDDRLVHKPFMGAEGRGAAVGYYSIIKYKGGGYVMWHMTKAEAEEWRDLHAMARKPIYRNGERTDEMEIVGPWRDDFDAMAVKTTFLRAQTWAPKSTDPVLARAVAVDGAVRSDMDDDPDAMFDAPHPDLMRDGVLDGEVIDAQDDEPAQEERPPAPPIVDVGTAAPERSAPAAKLQTEFPPVPGSGDDVPVSQGVTTSIGRMIGKAGSYDDESRKAIVSRIAGLSHVVTSTSKLTGNEGRQVLQFLSRWEDAGVLAEQVAAVDHVAPRPAADEPDTGQKLPNPGTKAWHEARHPRRSDGRVTRADIDLDGDCGICEEDRSTR